MTLASLDPLDLNKLEASSRDFRRHVTVVVTGCAYSCCGRGWQRRDGYEQTYCGWVDNFRPPTVDGDDEGTFMLYSPGLGTISYVIAVRFSEVADVQWTQ